MLLAGRYHGHGIGGSYPAGTRVTINFSRDLEQSLVAAEHFRVLAFSFETLEPWASRQTWSVAVKELPMVSIPSQIEAIALADSDGLNYSFSWVPSDDANVSLAQLVTAFEAYARDDYDEMVFAANVGVESSLRGVLDLWLSTFFNPRKKKEFMRNDYSQYLRFWIPIVAQVTGAPQLPDAVMTGLYELMERRNEVGHVGRLRTPVDRKKAATLLGFAALGYHYARLLERHLARLPRSNDAV